MPQLKHMGGIEENVDGQYVPVMSQSHITEILRVGWFNVSKEWNESCHSMITQFQSKDIDSCLLCAFIPHFVIY